MIEADEQCYDTFDFLFTLILSYFKLWIDTCYLRSNIYSVAILRSLVHSERAQHFDFIDIEI
jgi:hypothetical protein